MSKHGITIVFSGSNHIRTTISM